MRRHPEIALARFAAPRYGVFTRSHAISTGHSPRMITCRLRSGQWAALHPGIYTFAGVPASWQRDEIAACDWARGAAAGRAAGFLHGLPGCENPPIEVITTDRHRAMPRCGITVQVTNRLPREQIVTIKNIPTTSIERTLMNLCDQLGERRAAIALDNALFRGLTTIGDLDYCLYRTARRGRNGCATLRELIKKRWELTEFPNSPLETVIFELFAGSDLPMPQLQHEIYDDRRQFVARPDFVFPEEKVVVEGHSRLWHTGLAPEKRDRDKHDRLAALNYKIVYVTWPDATKYGPQTLARIEALLAERRLLVRSERSHR